ncbi:MAG: hypothetical protein SGPRY_013803 [Prymnesium sp.]
MAPQRLFSSLLPTLAEKLKPTPLSTLPSLSRAALLRASAHLTTHAPASLLSSHAALALPLLSQWMEGVVPSTAGVQPLPPMAGVEPGDELHPPTASTLRLLVSVLAVTRKLLQGGASESGSSVSLLLPVWLKMVSTLDETSRTRDETSSCAKERLEGLEGCIRCIGEARLLPYFLVYPYKRQVLQMLRPALDHRKRRVRQAAAECINQWHQITHKR